MLQEFLNEFAIKSKSIFLISIIYISNIRIILLDLHTERCFKITKEKKKYTSSKCRNLRTNRATNSQGSITCVVCKQLQYQQKFLVLAVFCMHSTGRLACYEHRVVRFDTRRRVFAYYERITQCSCHATAPGRKHTKNS